MTASLLSDLIRQEVVHLPTYNAGIALDQFRAVYGIDCLSKLDSNESRMGPSPLAAKAMQEAANGVARYPDAANTVLRALIAQSMDTQADRIIVGNGSEDLIGALFRAVIRPNDQIVTICPSF
jgi:histidinol-phosphate aminotransferase